VRDVDHRVHAVLFALRHLLGERRGHAGADAVRRTAAFAEIERRAAAQVDGAAERVGALVGRVALDEFEALEHRAAEIVQHGVASHAALAGELTAVERDAVEARAHAAGS
jgi:hypothetical protein